jgi:photosystem II stability/assembly factor-like uncharacterized protein
MIKKLSLPILMSLIILALAGCNMAGTPTAVTSIPSSMPPTQTEAPSATTAPPTPTGTATEMPPTTTATATIPPLNPIQHFPSGQEFTITDIHMIAANTGWAIGGLRSGDDHVLTTTDGGNTWKDVTPPEPVAIASDKKTAIGYFQDAANGWVLYAYSGFTISSQENVWRTSDGGATWQANQPLDISGLTETFVPSDLQFVAGQVGWLLVHVGAGMNHDYVALYRSMDTGASWSRILDPYNDGGIQSCSKTSMLFTDATHGWLTGDCNGVKAGVLLYNSTDAGSTWQKVTLPAPTSNPDMFTNSNFTCGSYDPFFFSNDLGHLGVRCTDYTVTPSTINYYVYTTLDGGATWTSSIYPGEALYFVTVDTGWAITKKFQRTTDGGATWTTVSNVSWSAQMDFISDQIGWGVARAGDQIALVKTTDGSAHWTMLVPTIGP